MVGLFVVAAVVTARRGHPRRSPWAAARRGALGERVATRMLTGDGSRERRPHPLSARPAAPASRSTRRRCPPSARARRARSASRRSRRARRSRRPTATRRPGRAARPAGASPTRRCGSTCVDRPPAQVEAVGAALGLHPLIVEDVLEGNQRAKIETDGRRRSTSSCSRWSTRRRFVASEIDLVLGDRLPAHRPRRTLGSARDPPSAARASASIMAHGPDHLLWAICRRHRRRLLPVRRRARRRDRRGPGRGHRQATPTALERAVRPQARAHRGPPRGQPDPRGLQPADEPRPAAHRRGRARLLPRRLRPRHPPDRRARQLPRARVRPRSTSTSPRSTTTCR